MPRKLQRKHPMTPAQVEAIDNLLIAQGWNPAWISKATREKVFRDLNDSKHPAFRDR
jgi:hypothetical protein